VITSRTTQNLPLLDARRMGRPIDFSCKLGEEGEGMEANTLAQKSDVAIPFCRPPKLKLQA
jgi:hypothetical protein